MTGWRIGVVIAPENISSRITLLSESIVSASLAGPRWSRAAILGPKVLLKCIIHIETDKQEYALNCNQRD